MAAAPSARLIARAETEPCHSGTTTKVAGMPPSIARLGPLRRGAGATRARPARTAGERGAVRTRHRPRTTKRMPRAEARGIRRARRRSAADGALRTAGLQGREPRVDLGELAEVVELVELRVEARRGELGLAAHDRLLAADLVLEASDVARRVEDVDRLDRVLHLLLRLRRLGARD